ncbi:sulfate/molybdate ABC transporter ATP-binding protein [Oribacterium sp. WCC10]|uniref:sulfate/molybdate ABC transporter ATP-binding protein n=1 Tax=Oribacterium sp. WCC10 TaxID=1855343 RepID=UPI0008F1578A|nr:ATP-binding cassette domain-containing protein [Oribacterium sp. WCC10]SFG29520.1 molybdate transport system ATP-binding protein [Oribacterium sp. WCC10]
MAIEVNIKKKFESFTLDVSFREDSKRIGILGASGSGKSMTLRSIAGIVKPDSGMISLNGHTLYDSARHVNIKPQMRNAGYLFQNYALFPNMTVEENIAAGLRGSLAYNYPVVQRMIKKFSLQGLEKRLPGQLSGGQQQRVAIARIMAYAPDVILLDEPFSALDIYLKDKMQVELMSMLDDYDGTVIMVSHSRDEIYRFSERLLIIDEGKVTNHGLTKDIFASPGTKSAAMLTGCKNFSKVEVMDSHRVNALDWGIQLRFEKEVPAGTHYIGYRAHHFLPVWGDRPENAVRFSLYSRAELQFETNYYVKPEKPDFSMECLISWFVQRDVAKDIRENGMPDYLQFREDDVLFLR